MLRARMFTRWLRGDAARHVASRLIGAYLGFALRHTRWTIEGEACFRRAASPGPMLVAFWHERLPLMPWFFLEALRRHPERRAAVLVSRHRDGRFIADIVARFGIPVVHGSTARRGKDKGGAASLRVLARLLAAGDAVVITPDGPRGPRRVAVPGVAQLAALSGAAVLPASAQITRRITLPSWDRMVLPLPWGRGVIVCLDPIEVPRDGWAAAAAGDRGATDRGRRPGGCAVPGLSAAIWHGAATLAAPMLRRMLRRRVARGKEIGARLPERYGIEATPRPPDALIWLHAASVGETVSILPVLQALPPSVTTLLTTGTVTSATLLDRRLPELGLQGRVLHRFVPLDVPRWAARFLDHWRPDVAAFVESEIWPSLLAGCRARRIPTALINARLSAASARRWAWLPRFAHELFGGFALVTAQSAADAARLRAVGAPTPLCPGNLKQAAPVLPDLPAARARLEAAIAGRPVWLAASTHPGEEAVAADVHTRLLPRFPDLLTIIVPRHPERGGAIAAMTGGIQRSLGAEAKPGGIYVADTLGELGLFYRLRAPVFMGKSLAGEGGQNPLEPARLGCAIAVGPATGNFAEAVKALHDAGALEIVADAAGLAEWVGRALADPAARDASGEAGRAVAGGADGLPAHIAALLVGLIPRQPA